MRASATTVWIISAMGLAMFVASLLALYPGWYSFDSAYLLYQARTGEFADLQPPAMALLWHGLLLAGAPPGSLLVLHLAMYCLGATLLGIATRHPAGLVLPLLLSWPPFLAVFGHLWVDVSLAASLTLAAGWIAWTRDTGRTRLAWLAALPLAYAVCVRHNAIFAVPPFFFLLLPRGDSAWRRGWGRAATAMGFTLLAFGVSTLLSRAVVQKPGSAWSSTAIWDLSAVSVATGRLLLPPSIHGPALTVAELAPLVNANESISLLVGTKSGINAGVIEPLPLQARRDLLARWSALPFTYPVEWLTHRARVTASLLGRQPASKTDGLFLDASITTFKDNPRIDRNDSWASWAVVSVAHWMRTTWWCAPIAYLAAALAAVGIALRSGVAREMPEVPCLALSAALFAVPLTVVVPSTDWRYALWAMLGSALALLMSLVLALRRRTRFTSPVQASSSRF